MAKPIALETYNIRIPALSLKSRTKSGLERLQMLLWGSELVRDGKELANLPSLPPLPSKLRVRLLLLFYIGFSIFYRLIDPRRGTDRPITSRDSITPEMRFNIYAILVAEEEAEALLINALSP